MVATLAICVAILAYAAAGPAPRFDAWRIIGPGGAGGMFLPTVSPHDPHIVLELCDMTGGYISLDAGRSWRMFNLRERISAFAFDPRDPKVIYAGNSAVWRSDDTGKTWRMIFPRPSKKTVQLMRDDHAEGPWITDDPAYPGGEARQIAIDPADSKRIYVLFAARGKFWLCLSKDRGASWTRLKEFAAERFHALYFDSGLRAVADSGVFVMSGERWDQLPGPPGGVIQSASGGTGMLYVTSTTGIHSSEDGGKTWRTVRDALPGSPRFHSIACSAQRPQTAYVGFTDMRQGIVLRDKYFGIAKTSDGGRHWAPVYQEAAGKPAPNVERAWIEDFYHGTGPVQDIGVSPVNPDVCYATDTCPRSFRTLNGGKTWEQIISARAGGDRWTTTGFDVTTCYGVHFDPFDFKNVFISYTDVGLFKSTDGGDSWTSSIARIPGRWRNTTYWIEFDPQVRGLIWGAFSATHDLPRPKMWQRMDPKTYRGGVGISTDGGEHWALSSTGMPETAVTHILLDPSSRVGARTLYACGFGRGVYKSTDNGKSWALKIAGIEKKQPFAWRITRARNGALYLVVSRRSDGRYSVDSEDGALYKSTDGAEHWTKMKLPDRVNAPTGFILDPVDQRRMYLSAWGAAISDGITGGGVFLSTDGGESWKNIFRDSQHVYDVTVDPKDKNVIYNSGFESGAYRSKDRGATWIRIRGFNFKWGHRVIPDPVDTSKIYITTFGGSVWHGPAAGDPKAVEDIVTP
jgi:photosystem II stability/assembly factor-like uncharacterized protein